jgi:hypothetical protein
MRKRRHSLDSLRIGSPRSNLLRETWDGDGPLNSKGALFPLSPSVKIRSIHGAVRNTTIHESRALKTANESGKFIRQLLANVGGVSGGANVVEGKRFQSLKEIFDHIDKDSSGSIDHNEFKLFLEEIGLVSGSGADSLSQNEIGLLIQCLDVDDDGEISFVELEQFVKKQRLPISPIAEGARKASAVEDGIVAEGIRRALAVIDPVDLMATFAEAMNKTRHLQRIVQAVERSFGYTMSKAHVAELDKALQSVGDAYERHRAQEFLIIDDTDNSAEDEAW